MTQNGAPNKEIISLAEQLIKIPSISGDTAKAIEILEVVKSYLKDYQFTPFVSNTIPSLLYTNRNVKEKQFTIILNIHLDVVPGLKEQFEPYIKDGKLYGRGAYDMKGAAAVMIILFRELAEKLPYALGLQITTDEESGGASGTGYQLSQGIRTAFVITGESGSNLRIIHEAKGMLRMKLISKGIPSHSAYPWLGNNAIIQMYKAISAIHKAYPHLHEEAYRTSVNVTYINTPQAPVHTITPKYCEAMLDIRYLPKESATIVNKIQSLLPQGVTSEVVLHTYPHSSDKKNVYMTKLQKAGEQVLGEKLALSKQHATSDARYYTSIKCDGVEFGPAGAGQHHTDEYVSLQGLADYYAILKLFLLSIA